ncbi:MAG TPA: hypothetical protein PLI51_07800 [bacterium]|nr:hypothetical protein [bacterium]HPQ66611.1 hypothetical protein [bacterium]
MTAAALRLLGLADRDPLSPTFACFDYPFWRSKTATYVNARLQEAVYSLALLYREEFPGNDWRGRLEIFELARAGMLFWSDLQHPDGSFDEWYRGEHGFAATAFSAFAVSRAFGLLEPDLDENSRERLKKTFARAGTWLSRHDDLDKLNHEAVAAAALYSLGEALQVPGFAAAASDKARKVLERQTGEGWFPELGGLDSGYSFLTLEYLAQCWTFSRAPALAGALEKALGFLLDLVQPDLTTGREYNLCGNSYVSLLGAAIMAEFSPAARELFLQGASRSNALDQLAQDDLSACYHLYNGLLSVLHYRRWCRLYDETAARLPCQGPPFIRVWPEAGLVAARTGAYYALCSARAGGTVKIYPDALPETQLWKDAGYRLTAGGRTLATGGWSPAGRLEVLSETAFRVRAGFREVSYFFPGRWLRMMVSLISAVPGGYLLIKKGMDLVRKRKSASLQLSRVSGARSRGGLTRKVEFTPQSVRIGDLLERASAEPLRAAAAEISVYSRGVLIARPAGEPTASLPGALVRGRQVRVEKEIAFPAGAFTVRITGGDVDGE